MFVVKPKQKYITKRDFLNYFKLPKAFWFLLEEEMEQMIEHEKLEEQAFDMNFQDYIALIKDMIDSPKTLAMNNAIAMGKLKKNKLLAWYIDFFDLPDLSIFDHSSIKEDKTKEIISVLTDPSRSSAFFYMPTLIFESMKAQPTTLFKHNHKIYLIENFWSTRLKQESIITFIFYHYVFLNLNLKISQYLITYLSDGISVDKSLLVRIGNSLPFTAQIRKPEGVDDPRMKNINTFFKLSMPYEGSLYEKLFSKENFYAINNEEWTVEDERLKRPAEAIRKLTSFLETEKRSTDFKNLANNFLTQRWGVFSHSTKHYKMLFRYIFPSLDYSSNVLSLEKSIMTLLNLKKEELQEEFLQKTSNLNFLSNFPKDQDYIVFPEAVVNYREKLENKKVKVYYDFETASFPFPFINNTKAYAQIVLQLSLIVTIDGIEQKPITNLIIDPQEVDVNSFKKIIDAIHRTEKDATYIVYNKSFENSRLNEMADFIREPEYSMKVRSIIDNTVDLADWFAYGNKPHIIHRQLKGFHSIKRVNKLIPDHIVKATGVIKYKDLTRCKDGLMAQNLLISRALVSDKESDEHNWNKNKEFMYIYCENDVRNMIAVELYIKELLANNKYPLQSTKKFIKEKLKWKRLEPIH